MVKIRLPVDLLIHLAVVVVVYILQSMVFTYFPVFGMYPVLLPIAAAGIGVFEGSYKGGGYGLLAGMLCDVSFNQPVLVMTVTLTIVGIGAGLLGETVLARGFPTFMLCSAGALLVASFVSMFSMLFFSGVDFFSLLRTGLYQTVYSIFFAVPFYFVLRALGRKAAE